jgi:hypothetical protein
MKRVISKSYFNRLAKSGLLVTPMINFGTQSLVLGSDGIVKLFVRNFNRWGVEVYQSIK